MNVLSKIFAQITHVLMGEHVKEQEINVEIIPVFVLQILRDDTVQ